MRRLPEVLLSRFCPQLFDQRNTESVAVPPDSGDKQTELLPKTWWWVEVWYEKRQLFKELVTYGAIFCVLFGMLLISHWIIMQSPFEIARVLLSFHLWNFIVLIIIFALRSSIRAVLLELGYRK